MSESQHEMIMRALDNLQAKAAKGQFVGPDEISLVTSMVYIFGKPAIGILV